MKFNIARNKLRQSIIFLTLVLLIGLAAILVNGSRKTLVEAISRKSFGTRYTVAERLAQYGESSREKLKSYFVNADITYPPAKLTILGLKSEREIQLYASDLKNIKKFIHSYPILAASGTVGPKLQEGDRQVPEGLYRIESLNPNSQFHLSMRLNYPNESDRKHAGSEGRQNLGGDIMIHGSQVSIGCIAIGDSAIEELFVLVADTGLSNVEVILAPVDFRFTTLPQEVVEGLPSWTQDMYLELNRKLSAFDKH